MKHNFKSIIAFIIVISVMFSVVAIPAHAEAGLSEALREDGDDLGWLVVIATVFIVIGTIILLPVLLVLSLIIGVEATTDMLQSFYANLIY